MITNAPAAPSSAIDGPFYLDAHIHIYPCFDESRVLDAAAEHVAGYDDGRGTGVMALTELRGFDVFRRWRELGRVGDWHMSKHGDSAVLFAGREDGRRLIVIAGRQIVTEGRLGVLALGTDADFEDGKRVEDSIEDALAVGALPVVSYGMGKWRGRRGRVIDAVIESLTPGQVAVGDIGVRPTWGKPPRQFRRAAERGLTILPGSDPLIIRASEDVVCSFCVRVDGSFPRADFRRRFLHTAARLGPDGRRYGGYLSSPRAIRDQLAMRCARGMLALRGQPR